MQSIQFLDRSHMFFIKSFDGIVPGSAKQHETDAPESESKTV